MSDMFSLMQPTTPILYPHGVVDGLFLDKPERLMLFALDGEKKSASASTAVSFSQSLAGSGRTLYYTATTSLALSGGSSGPKTHTDQQETIMTMNGTATFNATRSITASTAVTFGQAVAGGRTLTEEATTDVLFVNDPVGLPGFFLTQGLSFSQVVSLAGSVYNLNPTTAVNFSGSVTRQRDRSASTSITFSGSATRGTIGTPINAFTFNNSAVAERIRPTSSTLTFSHSVTREGFVRLAPITATLTFTHAAYADTSRVSCDTYVTALGTRTAVTLSYPVNTPTSTLNLRIPKFGDTKRLAARFKIKRTIAGFPRVTRVSTWPQIEVLRFMIGNITKTQRDDFLTFVELVTAASANFRLLDHENVNWSGIMLDPEIETINEGRGECQYQISFSFRGVRL